MRDTFCPWGTQSTFCTGAFTQRYEAFYNAGIRFDLITNPWMGWTAASTGCHGTCTGGYLPALGLPSDSVEAYEGPNECDDEYANNTCNTVGNTVYPSTTAGVDSVFQAWMPYVATLRSSSVRVYSPAMAGSASYNNYTYIGNDTDACAVHDEVNGFQTPEYTMTQYYPAYVAGCAHLVGNEGLAGTESDGWNTDISGGGGKCSNGAVDQLTQERYFPRDLLLHIQHGVRVYPYELLDDSADGNCHQYGLLDLNSQPKLVWTRIGQLMNYFADNGISPRTPLAYALTGDTSKSLYQVLFQKSDGTYILVPWLGTQLWDYTTLTDYAPATETLTLTLPASVSSIKVTMFGDSGSQTVISVSGRNGAFALPVSSLVEAVAFHV